MKIALLSILVSIVAHPAASQSAAVVTRTPGAQQSAPAAAPTNAPALAADPAKEAAIRKLFDVQGTSKMMQQVMASMSTNIRPLLTSSLPPGDYRDKLIDLFFEKFQSKLHVDQLIDLAVPVYAKYFSKEEIEQLTRFYQTPLGKKALSVQPQVLTETQAASMQLGQDIGRQSMMEVLDEHPDLKKALEDASLPTKN